METIQVYRKRIYHTPHRGNIGMQQRAISRDTQIGAQPPGGVASLSLKELAALLRAGLDGAGIDPGMSFMLRCV